MFAVASKIVPRAMAKGQIQVIRNANIMATAPRVRMPLAEKAAHGVVMAIGMLIVPAYIVSNFQNYRDGVKE